MLIMMSGRHLRHLPQAADPGARSYNRAATRDVSSDEKLQRSPRAWFLAAMVPVARGRHRHPRRYRALPRRHAGRPSIHR